MVRLDEVTERRLLGILAADFRRAGDLKNAHKVSHLPQEKIVSLTKYANDYLTEQSEVAEKVAFGIMSLSGKADAGLDDAMIGFCTLLAAYVEENMPELKPYTDTLTTAIFNNVFGERMKKYAETL